LGLSQPDSRTDHRPNDDCMFFDRHEFSLTCAATPCQRWVFPDKESLYVDSAVSRARVSKG